MKRAVIAVLTAFAVSGCGGFAGLSSLPLPGGPNLGSHPKTIYIEEADVLDLSRQATVKVNDVTVGEVMAIQRDGWHARVTLKIRGDVRLPANAVAAIQQTGLLGEKYVALSAPTGHAAVGSLDSGAVIGLNRTTRSFEVEQVLGALSLLLNGGGIDRIRTITVELNHALSGREQEFRDMLGQLNAFAGTLAANRTSIVTAIDGLDRLSTVAAAGHQTIAKALDRIPSALRILADERSQLVTMLQTTSRFADVATTTVQASRTALLANLRDLGPILDALANSGHNLPAGLQYLVTFPFPTNALQALKGDYFNFDLEARVSEVGLLRLLGLQGGANPVGGGGSGGPLGGLLSGLGLGGKKTPGSRTGSTHGLLGSLLGLL